jgi:hypothetical protein
MLQRLRRGHGLIDAGGLQEEKELQAAGFSLKIG